MFRIKPYLSAFRSFICCLTIVVNCTIEVNCTIVGFFFQYFDTVVLYCRRWRRRERREGFRLNCGENGADTGMIWTVMISRYIYIYTPQHWFVKIMKFICKNLRLAVYLGFLL